MEVGEVRGGRTVVFVKMLAYFFFLLARLLHFSALTESLAQASP